KHQGTSPRILLSDHPALAKLCSGYAEALLSNGFQRWSKVQYAFDKMANGLLIDGRMRRLYRDALLDQESNGTETVLPDPFTVEGARDFLDWLRYPASPQMPDVSRYLFEIYKERADLRAVFSDLTSRGAGRYLDWILAGGRVDPPIPADLMPASHSISTTTIEEAAGPTTLQHGINLHGYVFAESGTGQIGRALVAAVKAAGIPFAVIPFTSTINRQENPFSDYGSGAPVYDTNLICVNADQVPVFVEQMGSRILHGRYNIGVWAWEVEEFPEAMARNASLLDEVWGISHFAAAAIARKVTDIPVRAFPLPVAIPEPIARTRAELALPDGFLFYFCFDFESVSERKNPLAVINAFKRAFPNPGEASLYIKTVNGHRRVTELERLRAAASPRSDIVFADGYRSAEEQTAIMSACDVYVSLHRSEGFGLTLAEAMALGKPVIGTAYSSTAEFMTSSNSYLVPVEMVAIGERNAPYPANGQWASPDIDAAARFMRQAFENRDDAARRGERARSDIATLHSAESRAGILTQYLSDID
ncbi:MAG: glycosyltransferase family 4 protein, partial [Thermoanaerobaculia bacterium]